MPATVIKKQMIGSCQWFDSKEKHYGFIAGEDGKYYFFHQTDLVDKVNLPIKKDLLHFDLIEDERKQGKYRATKVQIAKIGGA